MQLTTGSSFFPPSTLRRTQCIAPTLHYPNTPLPPHIRVLLTGSTSIHGWPLYQRLSRELPEDRIFALRPPKMKVPTGRNVAGLCVTDQSALEGIRDTFRPTHVIHAAGVCDLDVCEERPQWAKALNVEGCEVVAGVFGAQSFVMHLSTDLVFSGNTPPVNGYSEDDAPDPVSVAGRTFAEGERFMAQCPRHSIVRLGLPLGDSINGDKGAFDWIEGRLKHGRPVTLFHDEWRSCITCEEIANRVTMLLRMESTGLWHCGGPRPISLHEVGKMIVARGGYPGGLLRAISRFEEKNGPPRIGNVSLDSTKLLRLLHAVSADGSWLESGTRISGRV